MVGKINARREKRATPGKKFGTTTYKSGGRVKKNIGGMSQGYNARLDDSLGARHPGAGGSLAGRRAMSKGMETAAGRGAYAGAGTMVKKGGSIKKAKGGKVKAMHGGLKKHTKK
jgi:hypothetical protein